MDQPSVEQKLQRFRAFYDMNLENGPLVGFFAGTYYPLTRYDGGASLPDGKISPNDVVPQRFVDDYVRLARTYEQVQCDTIWTGSVFWGLPWMEALSGCGVVADQATGSSRSVHPSTPPDGATIPSFDIGDPWVKKAGEFIDTLQSLDTEIPLGTTLMRGFSDLLSALYGTPEFVYRLADGGSEIEAVISKLSNLWIDFASFQLDRFPRFHRGTGSYFYNLWMPGRGVWIQEDASALLSPTLFDLYILPALERVIDSFDSVIIHLHPTDYIPVDSLIHTDVTAIELHIDKGGPTAEELHAVYSKIQKRKSLVIWGDLSKDDLKFIRQNLDLRALAVLPVIDTKEQAETYWNILRG